MKIQKVKPDFTLPIVVILCLYILGVIVSYNRTPLIYSYLENEETYQDYVNENSNTPNFITDEKVEELFKNLILKDRKFILKCLSTLEDDSQSYFDEANNPEPIILPNSVHSEMFRGTARYREYDYEAHIERYLEEGWKVRNYFNGYWNSTEEVYEYLRIRIHNSAMLNLYNDYKKTNFTTDYYPKIAPYEMEGKLYYIPDGKDEYNVSWFSFFDAKNNLMQDIKDEKMKVLKESFSLPNIKVEEFWIVLAL